MSLTKLEKTYIAERRAGKRLDPIPSHDIADVPWHLKGPLWSLGYHTGEDFDVPIGTPAVAVTWGHVIGAGWGATPHALGADYGNVVLIEKATGDYEYFYAHLSRFNVHVGDKVCPGQIIGWTGNTGHVTGPHLHFEARPLNGTFGTDVDPDLVRRSH